MCIRDRIYTLRYPNRLISAPLFLTLLGAFLFLCIWETRARYFFQFMMVLLCAGAMFDSKRAD